MKSNIHLKKQGNNFYNKLRNTQSKRFVLVSLIISFMFIIVSISNAQEFKIVKSGPSVANPGDIITYIIAVKSDGTIAPEVLITDYLPSDNTMTYVSSSPSGNYNKETNTLTWDKNNFRKLLT